MPVDQNSPCAFTLILPAWVPYNVIKLRRSTRLLSFNDVQNAMPQKIRSACLHESHRHISDLFPHMNEAWIRSRYIRMYAFFSCLHCHRTDPICVTKIRIESHLTASVNEASVASAVPHMWCVVFLQGFFGKGVFSRSRPEHEISHRWRCRCLQHRILWFITFNEHLWSWLFLLF